MCVDRLAVWCSVCWTHIRAVKKEPWKSKHPVFKVAHDSRRAEGLQEVKKGKG